MKYVLSFDCEAPDAGLPAGGAGWLPGHLDDACPGEGCAARPLARPEKRLPLPGGPAASA